MHLRRTFTLIIFGFVAHASWASSSALDSAAPLPDADLEQEVLEYISTPDPNRLDALSEQIVDEVYSEAQIARAKIIEIRLVLRRDLEQHGPSDEVKQRVAELEKRLEDEVENDRRARLVRDAIFVSASALGGASLAGAFGIEELQNLVEEVADVDEALNMHQRRLDQAYFQSRSLPATLNRPLKKALSPKAVVQRDLEAMGVDKNLIGKLQLTEVKRHNFNFMRFNKTNLPGLSFTAIDANGGHALLFGLTPSLFGNVHAWLQTRALSDDEIAYLRTELAFRDVTSGGKDFAILVDPVTREAFPTRLTMDQISAQSKSWRQGLRFVSHQHLTDPHMRDHLELYSLEGTYGSQLGSKEAEKLYQGSVVPPG